MRKRTHLKKTFLILALILTGLANYCFAQSKSETVNTAYFLTFGRFATPAENDYWTKGNTSFSQLVANNKAYLKTNTAERQSTVNRAFMDSFGWGPSGQEVTYFSNQGSCYADIVSYNMNSTLRPAPDKRQTVIKQSYYKVFNRLPSAGELNYWMSQPVYSFVQLVAFHSSWKSRNSQTSSVTGIQPGLNTNGIMTAGLSSGSISNLVASGGGNLVASGGGNLVASGGGNLVASGGGN